MFIQKTFPSKIKENINSICSFKQANEITKQRPTVVDILVRNKTVCLARMTSKQALYAMVSCLLGQIQ